MNTPSAPKTSGLAITSLVFGILGGCCPAISSLVAIICGHIALGSIKNSGGAITGKGIAVAGLVLGYLTLFLAILFIALGLPKLQGFVSTALDTSFAEQIHAGMEQMAADGEAKGDKSLGWPADAGITTVTELKKRLVDGGYIDTQIASRIPFENFQIGNVSKDDPESTIFIQLKKELFAGITIAIKKDGEVEGITTQETSEANLPPRQPPFLAP